MTTQEILESLILPHHECDDPWYNCPKSEEGTIRDHATECDCGAEEHNANVRELLRRLDTGNFY